MTNALASETSPYLRQHAENPVDWLPWGADALARAKRRGVPMLLSIGYSACHWCHVMEHESFEDDQIARQMNEGFVCVKVDREERPDIDALYMEAVQGMTGHGGWPLTVFLTPDGVPFYGGTYFPPQPRPGMPSFSQVLLAVGEAWSERGEEIAAGGGNMRERLVGGATLRPSDEGFDERALDAAVQGLRDAFDALHGGFGGAPKFPQASAIEFLLCRAEPTGIAPTGSQTPGAAGNQDAVGAMTLYTLRSMAGGGINDQLGGGFHRYAVDASWTVPHFEKMLYDNALLARAYLHGAQLADDAELLAVTVGTLDWMLDEMRGPEGGFYSALDADSEGVEGRFYVWTVSEMRSALGEDADADAAIRWLEVSEQGNFVDPHHPRPGLNVLEDRGPRPDRATRERIRAALLSVRERRTRPGLDDKRLTSWNALAISALAEVGAYLLGLPAGEPVALPGGPHAAGRRYLDAAVSCAEFVLRDLRDGEGRLLRTYSGGEAKIAAYLEDHAFLLEALIALFEATCEERWLTDATELADATIERFGDTEHGGFFSTAADGEALIARRKELEDSPIPAGGSSAALGLLRLAQLTGEQRYEQASAGTIALLSQIAPRHPSAFGHMLQAMHWTLAPMRPVACALPSRQG